MKAHLVILAGAMAALVGCQSQPESPPVPLLPAPITQDQAKLIAIAEMGTSSNNLQFVRIFPVTDSINAAWRVQYAHPIAGAWDVTIDKQTGKVLSKRTLPSR